MFGSALCNQYITTDFSESLLEMVTPTFKDKNSLLVFLEDMHEFIYKSINNESLWPFSIPPNFKNENEIAIANYGSSNEAILKMTYRNGLSHRYGRGMQAISGIHFNYSFSEKSLKRLNSKTSNMNMPEIKSTIYLRMIRNLNRMNWLLLYLFGSSPVITKSLLSSDHNDIIKLYVD